MKQINLKKSEFLAASAVFALASVVSLARPAAAEDCVHAAPTATYISATTQSGHPNEARFYVMDVTNNDSVACASSTLTSSVPFTASPTAEVWAAITPDSAVTVAPQGTVRVVTTVTAESYAAVGTYPFTTQTVQQYGDGTADAVLTTDITHNVVAYAPPAPGDKTKPNVSILYPTAGTPLAKNKVVTIRAQATDNVGVTQMIYRTDNGATTICSGNGSLTSCNWTPTKKGAYTLTVSAFDAAGNGRTASVLVNVR